MVLRISPERALLAEQVRMLGWFVASGRVPSVLAVDEEAGAMVLEEVLPGTPAEDMPAASLPQPWSDLLAALHGIAPPPLPAAMWGDLLRVRISAGGDWLPLAVTDVVAMPAAAFRSSLRSIMLRRSRRKEGPEHDGTRSPEPEKQNSLLGFARYRTPAGRTEDGHDWD
ncbi:hypothetical protein [Streptomyces sp. NPDC050416]|uniref:hypothetical protein n=1 Tax=Streptomyces sp. NPDC050416 TaxID=3365611 RepID=UPI0037B0F83C